MMKRIAKKAPPATITVALIANTTLHASSNWYLRPWRPQHRAGGMMMLGPPDRLQPRGTEAVTEGTSTAVSLRSLFSDYSRMCVQIYTGTEKEE